jgi:hypothetical protein
LRAAFAETRTDAVGLRPLGALFFALLRCSVLAVAVDILAFHIGINNLYYTLASCLRAQVFQQGSASALPRMKWAWQREVDMSSAYGWLPRESTQRLLSNTGHLAGGGRRSERRWALAVAIVAALAGALCGLFTG